MPLDEPSVKVLADAAWAKWVRAIKARDDIALGSLRRLRAEMETGVISKRHDWERQQARSVARARHLSPAEIDVLRLLSEGCSYRQAAEARGVSIETIKTQLERARSVLMAQTSTHAVAEAIRGGVL